MHYFGYATAWDDPIGMVVPGVMEARRNPTSPAAWGKAAVDIGLIGFSAAKIGSAARLGRDRGDLMPLSEYVRLKLPSYVLLVCKKEHYKRGVRLIQNFSL